MKLRPMTLTDVERDRYYASIKRRPLVIAAEWPGYSLPMTMGGGGLLGSSVVALLQDWPRIAIGEAAIGVLLFAVWWFWVASDGACGRRYERARRAAIRQRLCEIGTSDDDAKAAVR